MDGDAEVKKPKKFVPTRAMMNYAFARAKAGDDETDGNIAKQIHVNPATISHWWNHVPEFPGWLEQQLIKYRQPMHQMLEQVAIHQIHDHRFWSDLADKYGFKVSKDDKAAPPLIINIGGEDAKKRSDG